MADIHKIALPDGSSYDLISKKTYGIFRGAVDSTSTATAFTATIDGITELYDGLTISLKNPVVASASGCTLNINNLGAKGLWASQQNTAVTTGFPKNGQFLFTYDADNSRWVKQQGTQTTNTNTVGEYAGSCIAGPKGMARYSLIMKVDENHWESLVTSSSSGTTKTKNTSGFLLTPPVVLYQSAGTYASGSVAASSGVWHLYSFDTRYSTNGGQFSAAGKPFYLVGTLDTDNKFYLASTWWANDLPDLSNDNVYIFIGFFYSKYQVTLAPIHPIYKWIDGQWTEIILGKALNAVNRIAVSATQPIGQNAGDLWFVLQ